MALRRIATVARRRVRSRQSITEANAFTSADAGAVSLTAMDDRPPARSSQAGARVATGSPARSRSRPRTAALTALAGAGCFATVALLLPRAATARFDEAVLRALRQSDDPSVPLGGRAVAIAARDVTALGGTAVLVLVVGVAAAWFALDGRRRDAVAVLVASIGGLGLDFLLKLSFRRERPDLVPHLVDTYSPSFPSGHSMLSAVVYLTIGALLARFARRRATELLPIAVAIVVTVLVGVSRLILGVHYPTDVLAGWAAGTAWAGAAWLVVDALARRGTLEGRDDADGETGR